MKNQENKWIECGQGTLLHPVSNAPITTQIVELEGFGRIGEWFDYSNDPDGNFRLILAAPDLVNALESAPVKRLGHETDAQFIERYKAWYRDARYEALKKATQP